jgi:hypothetical protein
MKKKVSGRDLARPDITARTLFLSRVRALSEADARDL